MSDIYEQAIATLEREREALMDQWKGTLSDSERSQIWERIKSKEKQIEDKKETRKSFNLAATNLATASMRQIWKDELIKIDFKKAKALIENFKKNDERRYALWLLENSIVMEGELILRWLENYLGSSEFMGISKSNEKDKLVI